MQTPFTWPRIAVLSALVGAAWVARAAQDRGPPATAPFRRHLELRRTELAQLSSLLETLPHAGEVEGAELMGLGLGYLEEEVVPSTFAEERFLFPTAAVHGSSPEWATCLVEHHLIRRRVDDLSEVKDAGEFRRRGHELMGLLQRHYAREESSLLPVLDKAMTTRAFLREVALPMGLEEGGGHSSR